MTAVRALAAALLLATAACDWDLQRMNDQPRCEAGDHTAWLPDRRCDQPAPEGTVAWQAHVVAPVATAPTRAMIQRGADRFSRFCAPCHGELGDAITPVARDMRLRPPPSLYEPRIVASTDERLVQVITSGYGMMPAYRDHLPPADRWAVMHYVRVLQASQAVPLQALSADHRAEAQRWLR